MTKTIYNNLFNFKDTLNLVEAYNILNNKTLFDITYEEIKNACNIIISEISKIKPLNENDDDTLFTMKENFETISDSCFKNNEVFDLTEDAIIMLNNYLTELHTWADAPVQNIILKTLKRCKIVDKQNLVENKKIFFIKRKTKKV